MLVLLLGWAFFSASEAALFSLNRRDRRAFERGNRAERAAVELLNEPERLLTTILFWSLALDLAYFALASLAAEAQGFDRAINSSCDARSTRQRAARAAADVE